MEIKKEHIIGMLGLIPIVILFLLLDCKPSSKTNQTVEQKHSMPSIGDSHIATLDDIRFVELQIDAVNIDMDRYIGWFFDKKEMLKKASTRAVNDLELVEDYLLKLRFSDELKKLKKENLRIIDTLITIYDGIELKEQGDIKKDFAGLNDIYSQYSEKLKEVIKKDKSVEKRSNDFDPKNEEIGFAQTQQNGQVYLNPEKGMVLLSEIIDSQIYSPVLFEAFYKWRAQTQELWHGMSNMSNIPNWQYNLKRWQAIQTIRQYLKTNPDDIWAKTQANLLLALPNINRGGSFGNDNLSYWWQLCADVKDEIEKVGHE